MGGIVVGQGGRNGGSGWVFEGESDGGRDHGLIEGDGGRDGSHHAGCVGSRRLAGDGWDESDGGLVLIGSDVRSEIGWPKVSVPVVCNIREHNSLTDG